MIECTFEKRAFLWQRKRKNLVAILVFSQRSIIRNKVRNGQKNKK